VADFKLEQMALADLKKLKKDVDRAIVSFHERRKSEAAAEVEALAREKGFSLSELTSLVRKKTKPVAAKYRHPENPDATWSGRGRRPKWVTAELENGKTLDDLAI